MITTSHKCLGTVLALAGAAAIWSGCAVTHTEAVCPAGRTSVVLTALTSPSSIQLSQQAGPAVAQEIARRSANTCATLSTGVADAHPERDLALASTELRPAVREAPTRVPWIAGLQRKAEAWLQTRFLKPLEAAAAQRQSPVLTTIAAVAAQNKAGGRHGGVLVEITNAVAVETAPDGGVIDFRRPSGPELSAHLRSFIPSFASLKGGCVLIVGAGGNSELGADRLNQAHRDIDAVLDAAGIGLAWTRSLDVPENCRE